jgi:hypothetical protein
MQPGTQYGSRVNQVDMRFSRLLHFGKARVAASVDVFNLLNSNATQDWNRRFGPDWLKPTRILAPRVVQFGAQFDF